MTLSDKLAEFRTIFIDTDPIIYYIEAHPLFGPLAKEVADAFGSGKLAAYSSVITLAEVLPKPVKTGNEALVRRFSAFLRHGKNLCLTEISTDAAETAGRLRGKYTFLRAMDAIQIAVALEISADAVITNDLKFKQVKEVESVVLKDYLNGTLV